MARTVEQIERDLTGLKQSVRAIAQQFQESYARYLEQLGQAVRQQLVLACYHLCTQGYPDRFLKLSLSQRQELQQALLLLARQTQEHLAAQFQGATPAGIEFPSKDDDEDSEDEVDDQTSETLERLADALLSLEDSDLEATAELGWPSSSDEDEPLEPPVEFEHIETPQQLADWLERREEAIADLLYAVSQGANRLFQKFDILPSKLPEPILEVAAKSGLAVEGTAGMPNLLNLLVEIEAEGEQSSTVTHIMAIKLRLSEIEYADANLSPLRTRIRELSARLGQFKREFQKYRRELAIAEAEAAWRASWYE